MPLLWSRSARPLDFTVIKNGKNATEDTYVTVWFKSSGDSGLHLSNTASLNERCEDGK